MLPYEKLARIYAADRKFNRQNKSVTLMTIEPRQRPVYNSDDSLDEFESLRISDHQPVPLLKKVNVRASFNLNSSIEASPPPLPFDTIGRSTTHEDARRNRRLGQSPPSSMRADSLVDVDYLPRSDAQRRANIARTPRASICARCNVSQTTTGTQTSPSDLQDIQPAFTSMQATQILDASNVTFRRSRLRSVHTVSSSDGGVVTIGSTDRPTMSPVVEHTPLNSSADEAQADNDDNEVANTSILSATEDNEKTGWTALDISNSSMHEHSNQFRSTRLRSLSPAARHTQHLRRSRSTGDGAPSSPIVDHEPALNTGDTGDRSARTQSTKRRVRRSRSLDSEPISARLRSRDVSLTSHLSSNSSHLNSTQHLSSSSHLSGSSHSISHINRDSSIVWLEQRLPGRHTDLEHSELGNESLKSLVVDRCVKRVQLCSGKWRRWIKEERKTMHYQEQNIMLSQPQNAYRKSVYHHHQSTELAANDGDDFSVRLESVLGIFAPNDIHNEKHPERTQSHRVLFNLADSDSNNSSSNNQAGIDAGSLVAEAVQYDEARAAVLNQCGQTKPLPFEEVYTTRELQHCRKIGEGVFGEVFMRKVGGRPGVLKVIPIEGDVAINGEPQKRFAEIISEIVITARLSELRNGTQNACAGFVELRAVRCVRGCWPEQLIEQWELFAENGRTENDHPEVFGPQQLFVVLELAHAGTDLEAFEFQSADQALSALQQIAVTLAVAEQQLQFEHRDLHWGNILLVRTQQTHCSFRLRGQDIRLATHGVRCTIIDYTLSRIDCGGGNVFFNNLAADDELFAAGGDYQFDVYRLMRAHINNVWRTHDPFTNVMWLHYVCDKLITRAHFPAFRTKTERADALADLQGLRDQLFQYASSVTLVLECDEFGVRPHEVGYEDSEQEA